MSTSDTIIDGLKDKVAFLELSLKIRDTIINSRGLDLRCREVEDSVFSTKEVEREKHILIARLESRNQNLEDLLRAKELELKIKEVELEYTESGYNLSCGYRHMRDMCEEIDQRFSEIHDPYEQDTLRILFSNLGIKRKELETRKFERKPKAGDDGLDAAGDHSIDFKPPTEWTEFEAHRQFFPPADSAVATKSTEDILIQTLSSKLRQAEQDLSELTTLYCEKESELVELRMLNVVNERMGRDLKAYSEFFNLKPVAEKAEVETRKIDDGEPGPSGRDY
ncbi:hypothetical protein FKW77_001007 [Venturia effusa]|uniref:Uncharacterized protein n=1 Tax=Venturia effusa TaxID=50376 RepID=A0A517LJK5_9PEZI|nr:hypothetical protein FKW77_001007 [Venturia effusa]